MGKVDQCSGIISLTCRWSNVMNQINSIYKAHLKTTAAVKSKSHKDQKTKQWNTHWSKLKSTDVYRRRECWGLNCKSMTWLKLKYASVYITSVACNYPEKKYKLQKECSAMESKLLVMTIICRTRVLLVEIPFCCCFCYLHASSCPVLMVRWEFNQGENPALTVSALKPSPTITMAIFKIWLESERRHAKWYNVPSFVNRPFFSWSLTNLQTKTPVL